MFFRFLFTSLSCAVFAGCTTNTELKVPQKLTSLQSTNKVLQQTKNLASAATEDLKNADSAFVNAPKTVLSNPSKEELSKCNNKSQNISTRPTYQNSGNYMRLIPTELVNAQRNPLYELQLFANGQQVGCFLTVSGRTYTQKINRHRSGTEAPLPDGRYRVATSTTRGTIVEAGERFLPIQPLFRTSRTALGIHVDPSFEKANGEDGTSGCIGLKNTEELSQLLTYVQTYRPQFLDVDIQ